MAAQRQHAVPRQLQSGQHIVSAMDESSSQLALVAETFRAALAHGRYCVFLHHRTTPAQFAAAVTGGTGDLSREMSSGQLDLVPAREAYCEGGHFDVGRMTGLVAEAIARGNRGSFQGFCGCGELTWLAEGVVGAERLLEYEYGLNELGASDETTVMCIYDGRTLPDSVVRELRRVHPCEHIGGALEPTQQFTFGPEVAASIRLLEELEPPLEEVACDMLGEIISAAADAELSPGRQARLERHLGGCALCAETLTRLGDLKRALRQLGTPVEVPADFWGTMRSRLH